MWGMDGHLLSIKATHGFKIRLLRGAAHTPTQPDVGSKSGGIQVKRFPLPPARRPSVTLRRARTAVREGENTAPPNGGLPLPQQPCKRPAPPQRGVILFRRSTQELNGAFPRG